MKKQITENGDFVYRYPKEHTGKIDVKKLIELVKEHPDWYLREYAAVFGVCHKAIQKQFAKLHITHKKNVCL